MSSQDHLTEAEVALLADALNSGDKTHVPEHILAHVEECDQCAHEVAIVSQIADNSFNQNDKKGHRITFKVIGWSVAAGLALFITIKFLIPKNDSDITLAFQNNEIDSTATRVEKSKDITEIKQEKEKQGTEEKRDNKIKNSTQLLAFAENKNLEKLANRFVGASMRDNETIEILSPAVIQTSISSIKLEWKNDESQLLYIEIFNNQGEKIIEGQTSGEFYQPNQLNHPGLYYWKLINGNYDLLFCGKIIAR